jgi:c-di-GMP-binding flagellar brake protein YcgR
MSADLRASPRLATTLPVALQFPDADPPDGWGRLVDLSLGGAKLESRWPLKVGQAVYITFEPRSEMRLENLRARVVRVAWEEGYYAAGIAFDESVDQAYLREALNVLVNR